MCVVRSAGSAGAVQVGFRDASEYSIISANILQYWNRANPL